MKRILATLLLAASATASVAQNSFPPYGLVMVDDPKHCPPQTTSIYANYRLQDGRFVRDGWVCDRIDARS